MKIFAGGIATETNTFSPDLTGIEDFTVQRGKESRAGSAGVLNLSDLWGKPAAARGDEFCCSLMAWAQPSGTTVRSAYESLRDELLSDLQAALPVDIVLLMLHGAMVAQGYDSCEEDIIRRVRNIVGPSAIIGVELDLHCHLNESVIAAADIVLTYKEYPHTDINDRAQDVFNLAIKAKGGGVQPIMSLFDCQMIGLYPTTRQPMRAFVDAMSEAEKRPGVLSVSFGHGFHFADVPHVGAKMLVVTDNNPTLGREIAKEFGRRVYCLRREIGVDSISVPMELALSRAWESNKRPVVIADMSDNAGGGAPGDSTFALRWLLEHGVRDAAIAILHDPEVVRMARKAGVGSSLAVRLGGKTSPFSGDPVDVEVKVIANVDNYMHVFPQQSGASPVFPVGNVTALRAGGIDIVVSSGRCQCFGPAIFSDLKIDPKAKRILVVKSMQHFYGAFAPIAAEIVYMLAPGATAPDPKLTRYMRLDTTRLYPWSEDPLVS
jgi:microcystin degradation protein MlrC